MRLVKARMRLSNAEQGGSRLRHPQEKYRFEDKNLWSGCAFKVRGKCQMSPLKVYLLCS